MTCQREFLTADVKGQLDLQHIVSVGQVKVTCFFHLPWFRVHILLVALLVSLVCFSTLATSTQEAEAVGCSITLLSTYKTS
jgi:hypothetical protein